MEFVELKFRPPTKITRYSRRNRLVSSIGHERASAPGSQVSREISGLDERWFIRERRPILTSRMFVELVGRRQKSNFPRRGIGPRSVLLNIPIYKPSLEYRTLGNRDGRVSGVENETTNSPQPRPRCFDRWEIRKSFIRPSMIRRFDVFN